MDHYCKREFMDHCCRRDHFTAAEGCLGSRAELDEAAARGDLGRTAVEGNVGAIQSSFMIFFFNQFRGVFYS